MLKITLAQAIDGYLIDATARQLSPCTIRDYQNAFRHLGIYLEGDPIIADITVSHLRGFFHYLSTTPITPNGCAQRSPQVLSKKTIKNIHAALSALWTWAINEQLVNTHIPRAIKPPKPESVIIQPFSKADITALLTACEKTPVYSRPGKANCANSRPTALRDRALLLTLLDTGARASELCADPRREAPGALLRDYNERTGVLRVCGKGDKERLLILSARTQKALWRYLLTRPTRQPHDNIFTTVDSNPLTSTALLHLCYNLGARAGVSDCHPHRFRHTFAIQFLRNGGRVLELQQLLGHTTLQMVEHYVALAQTDLDAAMRHASPVENWRL